MVRILAWGDPLLRLLARRFKATTYPTPPADRPGARQTQVRLGVAIGRRRLSCRRTGIPNTGDPDRLERFRSGNGRHSPLTRSARPSVTPLGASNRVTRLIRAAGSHAFASSR